MSALSASSLWRAALCPASVALPQSKREFRDAKRGHDEHARLRASLPPEAIGEIAFAYDVLTGRAREIGRDIGRDYGPLAPSEIPGTADVVRVEPSLVRITDWKTGFPRPSAHAEEPAKNLQLHHNAVCAAQVFGRDEAVVEICWTRTGEIPDAHLDAFDLAATQERLRAIWESTQNNPAPIEGEAQCWRCPAMKACPAKGNAK